MGVTVIDGIGDVLVGRTGGLGPCVPTPVDVLPTAETVVLAIGEKVPTDFEPGEIPALGFDDVETVDPASFGNAVPFVDELDVVLFDKTFGTTPSSEEGDGEEGKTPAFAPGPRLGEVLATGLEEPCFGSPPEPVIDADGMPDLSDVEEVGLASPKPDDEIFGLTN